MSDPAGAEHPEAGPVKAVAGALAARFGDAPPVALVLGSGLGSVAERVEGARTVPQAELGLPVPTVAGHAGVVIVGRLGGRRVALLAGRVHLYEGHSPAVVVRSVRALHAWGVRTLLLTNAAGSLDPELPPGALVRLVDHLNLTGTSSLLGRPWGQPFPDASCTWSERVGDALDTAAQARGVELTRGVYAGVLGPQYETRAEVRMLQRLGAHVVGMSTVHEALAATAVGLEVGGIATVTNLCAGVGDAPTDHAQVTAVAAAAAARLADVFEDVMPRLG